MTNYYLINNYLLFGDNSTVYFSENSAGKGGAVYGNDILRIRYYGHSSVTFSSNYAALEGVFFNGIQSMIIIINIILLN